MNDIETNFPPATANDADKKAKKRAVRSWILYDWANSAFACTVMAAFFPIYFKNYLNPGVEATLSTSRLGVAASVSSFIIALLSPTLGAIADSGSYKKRLLFLFCYLGVLASGGLFFVHQGEWQLGAILYALGFVGFAGANTFYDSLLPGVTTREKIDFVSAAGFAWGYLGGGLLFSLNVLMALKPDFFGWSDQMTAIRWSFLSVALWWGSFALPLFFFVKEPASTNPGLHLSSHVRQGFRELKNTLRGIRHHRAAALFLLAFFFYNDGVNTTIKMAVDYGLSIGFASSDLIITILMVQFIGFPSALGFGWFGQRFHPKTGIYICLGTYLFALIWAMQMTEAWEFYLLGGMVGLTQGGVQALSRSYFSRFFPWEKSGEFYGFFNLLGKFSGVIGPLLISATALLSGSSRLSLLSLSLLFVIGGFLLTRVQEPDPSHFQEKV